MDMQIQLNTYGIVTISEWWFCTFWNLLTCVNSYSMTHSVGDYVWENSEKSNLYTVYFESLVKVGVGWPYC